ncbi:hypothetical protein ACLKA6_003544 [Drosophila palustris]
MEHLKRHLSVVAITHVQSAPPSAAPPPPPPTPPPLLPFYLRRSDAFAGPLDQAERVLPTIRKLLIWVTINCFLERHKYSDERANHNKGHSRDRDLNSIACPGG